MGNSVVVQSGYGVILTPKEESVDNIYDFDNDKFLNKYGLEIGYAGDAYSEFMTYILLIKETVVDYGWLEAGVFDQKPFQDENKTKEWKDRLNTFLDEHNLKNEYTLGDYGVIIFAYYG